jgi:uncharacterized Zn-binding protein involved in type VI secretion
VSELQGAARRTDLVDHGEQAGTAAGKIASAAYDTAKTAYTIYRIAKLGAVVAGPAGWLALGASFVVEWAVSTAIEEGVKYLVKKGHSGMKEISTGSPNVFVNKLEAARGQEKDDAGCHKKKVKQGSQWVTINKMPAARLDDLTTCPGNISTASTNVAIGGPPTEYNPHRALENTLLVLSAYNALKKGLVKGVVNNAMKEALKDEAKDWLKDQAKDYAKGQAKDAAGEQFKDWTKDQGTWPW